MVSATPAPSHARVYEKSTVMKTTMERMQAFHEAPTALSQLTPPPIFVQLLADRRTSITEGDLEFILWLGPIPIRWHVEHQSGPTPTSFADFMLSGPMAYWRHEHVFEKVEAGVRLTDRVTLAHKPGPLGIFTRLMFDGLPLRFLFFYRHLRTKLALSK